MVAIANCQVMLMSDAQQQGNHTNGKLIRFYQLCLILLFIVGSNFAVQAQSISVSYKNAPLQKVLKDVEKQSGYQFFFNESLIAKASPVTVEIKNETLEKALQLCFQQQPLTYSIVAKTVVIKEKIAVSPPRSTTSPSPMGGNITIHGKVTDKEGKPVAGVSVRYNNSNWMATTDDAGIFNLPVPSDSGVLKFSHVSLASQNVTVKSFTQSKGVKTVALKDLEDSNLDDVVVIGYAQVKRRDLTGAVSSVSEKDLKDIPVNSAEQALAGRLAGVQVTGSEGSPDAQFKILVRGGGSVTQDNSPLYIIDGVQVEDGLSSISPQDIASIDVLKDAASTSIYGARGANGVILVTTKSGKEGPTQITYNGFVGVNKLAHKLDVMDPYNFVLFQYERSRNSANDSIVFASRYATSFDQIERYKQIPANDWQEIMMGKTALMHTHNIAFSGGTKTTKFSGSYTYNAQEGIVRSSDYDRHLLNFKLEHNASAKLKIGFNMRFAYTRVLGNGTSSPDEAKFNKLRNIVKYRPVGSGALNPDEEDDDYFTETNVGNGLGIVNPVVLFDASYRRSTTAIHNYTGFLNYSFNDYFSFRPTIGINYNLVDGQTFNDKVTPSGALPTSIISRSNNNSINQSNVLSYSNARSRSRFAKSNSINVLIGQEVFISNQQGLINRQMNYPDGVSREDALNQLSLGQTTPGYPLAVEERSTLLSFFSRAGYSYKNKYLLTLTMRADGSSKFAENNRWGYFPAGAIAWRISEEKFMTNLNKVFSDLKLRLSYGLSGNNRIGNYLYFTNYSPNSIYALNDIANIAYASSDLANKDLKWETTISRNVGLDFGLFKNRISVSLDAYRNSVEDVLFFAPVPITSGYTKQLRNTGSTVNQGLELQLNATVLRKKNFNWAASFNISTNRNTIKSISSGQNSYVENSGWGISGTPADYIVKVGSPVGSIYGYTTDGFYTLNDFDYNASTTQYTLKKGVTDPSKVIGVAQPGLIKFKDMDGDGVITSSDQSIIGNATPKFFGGLNQQVSWKNFDASVFVNFQYGNDVLNANKIEFTNAYAPQTNMLSIMNNRWKTIDAAGNVLQQVTTVAGQSMVTGAAPDIIAAANANATIWMPLRSNISYYVHSWAVEDASFLRINNITLGYTFGKSIMQKLKIKRIRAYATLNNIAVLTSYTGYDPEVNTRRSTPVTPGVDYSAYPRSRNYIFGLNVTF